MTRFRCSRALQFAVVAFALTAGTATAALAQGAIITGTVKSEQGQALEGAQVLITELNVSVGTNAQGQYRISLPAERVRGQTVGIRVRALGYQPQTRQLTIVAGNNLQDFTLRVDVNRLSEVVITGVTGATETKKLAFTVDKVDQAQLQVPGSSALSTLQGKVTGANIVMPSGRPGTSPSIVLRGVRSINRPLSPLIVVDGVIIQGSMSDIDPNDIESIEVVKGAAAASTFGSNAQNGVIQITTKSAKNASQGAKFGVRSEFGATDVQSEYPYALYHMMSMDETNRRFCAVIAGQPDCGRVFDWEEERRRINNQPNPNALDAYPILNDWGISNAPPKPIAKGRFQINPWPKRYNPIAQAKSAGPYNDTHVDMTARFGQTGVFASLGGLYQEGAFKYAKGFRRKTARLNADQGIADDLSLQVSTIFSKTEDFNLGNASSFFNLTRVPAGVNLTERDDQGRLFVRSNINRQGQGNSNWLYQLESAAGQSNADRYLGNLTGRYTPLRWLEFQGVASIDKRRTDSYSLFDKGYRGASPTSTAPLGSISHSSTQDQQYNVSLTATARTTDPLGIRDLQARWNTAYSFERGDGHDVSASGNTLAVPGVLTLGNATVYNSPSSSNATTRAMGILNGIALDYKGRYLADATIRRDGSSLFGASERWHSYYRGSLAWRLSDEPWWMFKGAVNDLKLRGSVGTAGGRPGQTYQYETFSIGTGGTLTANQLGNKNLKPETTTETEYGFDAELFSKYGITLTYARSITEDQMLSVPVSSSSGFGTQWRNAGQLDSKTWEASLNIPLVTTRSVVWTSRIGYDRTRSYITGLDVAPFNRFTDGNSGTQFRFQVGERIGQLWGKHFVTECSQLPAPYSADCGGAGKAYQKNSDGFIVWTGGFDPGEGITRNAWQSQLSGCVNASGQPMVPSQTGIKNCLAAGGFVNAPWGQNTVHWGMVMGLRDSTGAEIQVKKGNTLPDFHLSMSHNVTWKRLTFYALIDGNYGNRLYNNEIHWSLGDFNVRLEDQDGRTVETAKPIGYYWRATTPENGNGVSGFYNALGGNNVTIQPGTYTKIREASVTYSLGPVRGVGDWSLSLVGRNLYTITDFMGWDPETGGGGAVNSNAIGATADFNYPPTRAFTVTLTTRF